MSPIPVPRDVENDPQGYYYYLVSNGFPHDVAYSEVVKKFGPPKSREQQLKDQQNAQTNAGWAQVGGALTGTIGAGLIYYKWDDIKGWIPDFSSSPTTPSGNPTPTGGSNVPVTSAPSGTPTPGGTPTQPTSPSTNPSLPPAGSEQAAQIETMAKNDPEFMKSVDWGAAAQLGLGVVQLYGAYKAYKNGDKAGAGLMLTTGGANTYAGGAQLATGSAQYAGSQTLGYVMPGLNLAAGAYGMYKTSEYVADNPAGATRNRNAAISGGASGAALGAGAVGAAALMGASMGAWAGPIGMGIGALVGAGIGFGSSIWGSSKSGAQMDRDSVRKGLKEAGLLNDKWEGTLANGTLFDFGKDGSVMSWKNFDKLMEENPNSFGKTVNLANVMTAAMGLNGRTQSNIAYMYARAAQSNAGDNYNVAKVNMQHFTQQLGFTPETVRAQIEKQYQDGNIDQNAYNTWMSTYQELFTPVGSQPGQQAPMVSRAKKGEVNRVSPGLYRNDQGKLVQGGSMRQALERAYSGQKGK